jgi:hypoxanthine phosphoribosyltransferase
MKYELTVSDVEISRAIMSLAYAIHSSLEGDTAPCTFLVVANGAIHFGSDLTRAITKLFPEFKYYVDVVKTRSYQLDTNSPELPVLVSPLDLELIEGHNVVILDDVYDSGRTIALLKDNVEALFPKSIKVCVLLNKHLTPPAEDFFIGVELSPDSFVYGYGLDLNGFERGLSDIYSVIEE